MLWCERRDLNPYGVNHTPLKRARLPVPPLSHIQFVAVPLRLRYYIKTFLVCQHLFAVFSFFIFYIKYPHKNLGFYGDIAIFYSPAMQRATCTPLADACESECVIPLPSPIIYRPLWRHSNLSSTSTSIL